MNVVAELVLLVVMNLGLIALTPSSLSSARAIQL